VKPTRFVRWVTPIIFLVIAGVFLSTTYQNFVQGGLGNSWLIGTVSLITIGLAPLSRSAYIRVDDSTIVFGPKLPGRRTFDRREVARIVATPSPFSKRTLFLRSDGSTMWSTPGFAWGRASLQSLADYLGVPFEGWSSGWGS
jgi:hypothetical protein